MKEKVFFSFRNIFSWEKRTLDFCGTLERCLLPTGRNGLVLRLSASQEIYLQLSDYFRNRLARYSFQQYVLCLFGKKTFWFTKNRLVVDADNDGVPEQELGVEWGGELDELLQEEGAEEEPQTAREVA